MRDNHFRLSHFVTCCWPVNWALLYIYTHIYILAIPNFVRLMFTSFDERLINTVKSGVCIEPMNKWTNERQSIYLSHLSATSSHNELYYSVRSFAYNSGKCRSHWKAIKQLSVISHPSLFLSFFHRSFPLYIKQQLV